jgi:acetyl esterase/lipase
MMRAAVPAAFYRPLAVPLAGQSVTSDVLYRGALGLDVYQPGLTTTRPAVLVIHGGGWTSGDKTDAVVVGTAQKFSEAGFRVFDINYTIVPGANATANYRLGGASSLVADVLAAVQWVRDNAATYHADPTKVGIVGLSAGGHLALMAACVGVAGATRPDAVAAWSPPTRFSTHVGLATESACQALIGAPYVGNEATWNANSPYNIVTKACCPLWIVNSASEDPATGGIQQSQADDMYAAALAAGVDVTKTIYTGSTHSNFKNVDLGATTRWLRSRLAVASSTSRSAAGTRAAAGARTAAT